jgi:hypothetical protein
MALLAMNEQMPFDTGCMKSSGIAEKSFVPSCVAARSGMALFIERCHSTKTLSVTGSHYCVKTGKVPKELAQIYNDLFERRREGDYVDFVRFAEPQALPRISDAERFVEYIASLVEGNRK